MIRGVKHDQDRFINELSAQYLPFNFKGQRSFLQVGVRPIQLFELTFPEEHLQLITGTLGGNAVCQHKRHNKYIAVLRRMLGKDVKKSPVWDKKLKMPVYCQNLEIIDIGTKEDYWRDNEDKRLPDGEKPKDGQGYEAI